MGRRRRAKMKRRRAKSGRGECCIALASLRNHALVLLGSLKDLTQELEHAINKTYPALHQKKNVSEDLRLHLIKDHEVESKESWLWMIILKIRKSYLSCAPFLPDIWDFLPDLANCVLEKSYLVCLHKKSFDDAEWFARANFACIIAARFFIQLLRLRYLPRWKILHQFAVFVISLLLAFVEIGEPKKIAKEVEEGKEVELNYFSLVVSLVIMLLHCLEPTLVMAAKALYSSFSEGYETTRTGLQNEDGSNNCFLNVIIQSLWHIPVFRVEFKKKKESGHLHVGSPCVVCALYEVFDAIDEASDYPMPLRSVSPLPLRAALGGLPSSKFKKGIKCDASEVLEEILGCLHMAFETDAAADGCNCIACSIFGMRILHTVNCRCLLQPIILQEYDSYNQVIKTSDLTGQRYYLSGNLCFDETNLKMCEECGKRNLVHYEISKAPKAYTTVLAWEHMNESEDTIMATLGTIPTELDMKLFCRSVRNAKYRLLSMACYESAAQHYHYVVDIGEWIHFDDETVKEIGGWQDILNMCKELHLQPQVLIYVPQHV